jgi:hypothetical protein
LNNVSERKLPI